MEVRTVSRLEIEAPDQWNGLDEPELRIIADDGSTLAGISIRTLAEAIAPYLSLTVVEKKD